MSTRPKPVVLLIADGYAVNPRLEGNAVAAADTPFMKKIIAGGPSALLTASGEAVGLPAGQMGNSEVGHLNLGAGRVVYQEFTRVSKAIKDGSFFSNAVLLQALDKARDKGKQVHFMGLLSDGGVHSHQEHLYGLLEMAKKAGLPGGKVLVHCFLDGRDTPPRSGAGYLAQLEEKLASGLGRVAMISGRYFAMDRDKRWDRVEKAWRAMVLGEGQQAGSSKDCMRDTYAAGVTDEFVVPTVIKGSRIEDGDSIIFFNFRADRAREITRAFVDKDFTGFSRPVFPKVNYVCLTQYDETIQAPVAFPPQSLVNILGEVLANNGLKQLRIAETEKYAHVTFFFNGGEEKAFQGEDRALIPSPKVATYDLKPEMSAFEVADEMVKRVESGKYDVIILNFANSDMVGHTGVWEATLKALQAVDACVKRVVEATLKQGGVLLFTADHGNADQMIDYALGGPFTAHTTNPVPFVLLGMGDKINLRGDGSLADVAPTMLSILGIPAPKEMTGQSLIAAGGSGS